MQWLVIGQGRWIQRVEVIKDHGYPQRLEEFSVFQLMFSVIRPVRW